MLLLKEFIRSGIWWERKYNRAHDTNISDVDRGEDSFLGQLEAPTLTWEEREGHEWNVNEPPK